MPFCKVTHTLHVCLSLMNACYGRYNAIVAISWDTLLGLQSRRICPPSLFSQFCFSFEILSSLMFWPNWLRLEYRFIPYFFLCCISKPCWRVSISSKNCLLFRSSPKYHCCCWRRLSDPSAEASSDHLFNIIRVDKCCQPFKHLMRCQCTSCCDTFAFWIFI